MSLPSSSGIFIHEGLNCSPTVIPTAQSIPMSPSDSTTVKTAVDNKSDLSIIADEYDTSATYTIGDFVIYDKVLYKCIMYSTTGDWDSTRWVAVNSKDSGINLKNSSGNTLVKIWEDSIGRGTISLYDKTTGYETVSLYGSGYVDAKSITVMTSGASNSGRVELTTTQSNSGYISLRDNNKNTPIELNADDGNINAVSLNGVTIGSSPKFTDTTYESKTASSGGTDLSLVTTGEKYTWNNKASTNTTYTFTNGGTNKFTVTPSGGNAQDVTFTASDTTRVAKSGDTMTGQLKTSFNQSVATGSYQASATTIPNLCEELRYSSGVCGSAQITTAYTKDSITIGNGWYNFLWIPHRSGGINGSASGDNCNYGALYLSGMTVSGAYLIRYASSIAELHNLYADANYLPLAGGTMKGSVTCTTSGANLKWGNITLYGGGSNGGNNSILIGDDVTIGDCNVGGCFGMKSTGNNAGFRFFNSSGNSIGGLQSTNGTLQWINSSGTAYNVMPQTDDLSSSLSVSGNLQSVTKKLFKCTNVVELFMTGKVKTAIADNAVIFTVPTGYNPKVNDVGFTFFTGTDQYIPTGFKFGYFTWGGRDFHTLGALGVGTQVTVHITYLI